MSIIVFLLVGLIAGWLASLVVTGRGFGVIGDVVIGIIGALVGGFIFSAVGLGPYGIPGSIVTAAVGAVVFLFLVRLFVPGSRAPKP